MTKDDVKSLIIIIIIFLTCLTLIIVFGKKNNSDDLSEITDYSLYFSAINNVNKYLKYNEEQNNKAIYNLLDSEFIKKNNITEANVFESIVTYPSNAMIRSSSVKIKYSKLKYKYIYYIKGNLIREEYESQEMLESNFSIILIIDYNNLSLSIYPLKENDNYKKIIDNIKEKDRIPQNYYNSFEGTGKINQEDICILYLSDYITKLGSDIEKAYKMLSDDMREKYPTIDSFKKFIGDNQDKITATTSECSVKSSEYGRYYSIIDKNKNEYKLTEKSVMNYEIEFSFENK